MGRLTSREKRGDLVFAAEDPFRNIVRLERFTWENHIVPGHPEVDGIETAVLRKAIEAPDTIHQSAAALDCAVFQKSGIVILVVYESLEFASAGETFGRITTVYPQPIRATKLTAILYPGRGTGRKGST